MNDIVFGLICAGLGIIGGILISLVVGHIHNSKKRLNHAGWIILDERRDCTDSISLEGPRNISQWRRYRQLVFDVDVMFDE